VFLLTLPPKQKTRKQDDPEQSKAFIEKAREIEADEEHSAADKLTERPAKTPKSRKPAGKPSTHTPTNLKR
jgi:hypothetical protein